jgi:integrase
VVGGVVARAGAQPATFALGVRKNGFTPDDAVFALRDNKNWWGKVLRRAKVKNFRWHDLRHTFCSRLAHRGVDTRMIQELAGHKTIQMSARYSHLNKTSVLKGLAVLEENIPEAKEK